MANDIAVQTVGDDCTRRDHLLSLIDGELRLLEADATRAGWTPYALVAALAALVWLTLNQPDSAFTPFAPVLLASMALVLAGRFFLGVGSFLLGKNLRPGALDSTFSRARSGLWFWTFVNSAILGAALWLGTTGLLPVWSMILIAGLQCAALVLGALLLALTLFPIPLEIPHEDSQGQRRRRSRKQVAIGRAGIFILFTLQLVAAMQAAIVAVGTAISAWRLPSLLAAAVYVLHTLFSRSRGPDRIESQLVDIRRRLVLGLSTPDEVRGSLRTLLIGMPMTGAFAFAFSREVESLQMAVTSAMDAVESRQKAISELLDDPVRPLSGERQQAALSELLVTLDADQLELRRSFDVLRATRELKSKAQVLRFAGRILRRLWTERADLSQEATKRPIGIDWAALIARLDSLTKGLDRIRSRLSTIGREGEHEPDLQRPRASSEEF